MNREELFRSCFGLGTQFAHRSILSVLQIFLKAIMLLIISKILIISNTNFISNYLLIFSVLPWLYFPLSLHSPTA